jgi:hypothetical protein
VAGVIINELDEVEADLELKHIIKEKRIAKRKR